MLAQGYRVDRLYKTDTAYHPEYIGDATPRRYRNLSLLPSELAPGSGFPWTATTADVTNAINEGASSSSTATTAVRTDGGVRDWRRRSGGLTNGDQLPVLFSVDCATGFFDNETAAGDYSTDFASVYFLEAMLRLEGGGIVGALGDTRNSPSWANNALLRGFADAVFPNVIAGVGPATPILRLADILNYGKLYMFTQVGLDVAGQVARSHVPRRTPTTCGTPSATRPSNCGSSARSRFRAMSVSLGVALHRNVSRRWGCRHGAAGRNGVGRAIVEAGSGSDRTVRGTGSTDPAVALRVGAACGGDRAEGEHG